MGSVLAFIWSNFKTLPKWGKWYFVIVCLPNLIGFLLLTYFFLFPWYKADLHATITPMRQLRDQQIAHIIEVQQLQNNKTNETLSRIEQHQSLLYQTMLARQ